MLPWKTSTAASTEIEYVSYGPHPFIVQVRDLKTHQPLPGIAVGDIGPKYGYASMDNAYMLFDNFHIPHSAFLSRYAKVNPKTGAYSKPSNPAVVYGSLTYVRANIVMHARLVLARAVTIAVRYLSIRHQFRSRDSTSTGPEEPVLNYPTVQIRILPLLATTFALHYTGQAMSKLYMSTRQGISQGDFSALADLHSTSSGLKSLCTTLAADGIETCRRAMGGHGYGGGSGLIQLNADYLSKPTVEGDNWMITQQTAAHLIKKVSGALADPDAKASDATDANLKAYFKARRQGDKGNKFDILNSDQAIVDAFRFRAAFLAVQAHEERIIERKSWNSMLIQLHALSNEHSQAILVENFHAALHSPPAPSITSASPSKLALSRPIPTAAHPIMLNLFRLFALTSLLSAPGSALEFLHSGCVSLAQVSALPSRIRELMAAIRPHAVALVDAWSVPDYLLDSALGRGDGRVYEELFERARDTEKNPLNAEVFNPWYWEEEIVMGSGRGWDGGMLGAEVVRVKGKM
jgi:acyl-CoA oxidase